MSFTSCMSRVSPSPPNAGSSAIEPLFSWIGVEGLGAYEVADRMMELLGGCSPKDFSPCDNRVVYRTTCEKIHSLSLAQCSGVHSSIQLRRAQRNHQPVRDWNV